MKYKLTATHGAVRAHRPGYFRSFILGTKRLRAVAHRFRAGAISALQNLTEYRPSERKFLNHLTSSDSGISVYLNGCSTSTTGYGVLGVRRTRSFCGRGRCSGFRPGLPGTDSL